MSALGVHQKKAGGICQNASCCCCLNHDFFLVTVEPLNLLLRTYLNLLLFITNEVINLMLCVSVSRTLEDSQLQNISGPKAMEKELN